MTWVIQYDPCGYGKLIRHSLLVIGYSVLVFLAAGCRNGNPRSDSASLPSQVVEGFVLHESSRGERLYTLEAETAYVYEAEERVEVVLPRTSFYDSQAQVHAVLVADRGMIYSKTNDLIAHGHVNVVTADSTKLWTDSLCWNNGARLVKTDAPVEIETPKGRVRGIGLVSDAGLSKIEIQSEVEGTSEYDFGQNIGATNDSVAAENDSAEDNGE